MNKSYKLTQEGIDELNTELQLLVDKRPEITERIRTARELGDLSENAEYSSARSEQDRCELRIKEISYILKNSVIINNPTSGDKVHLGSRVKLANSKGAKKQYQVVGTVEADPLEGKISDESPIGKALLGKKLGDEVSIVLPSEIVIYNITEIS